MYEYISGWEWITIGLYSIVGFLMILFMKQTRMIVYGVILLIASVVIAHNTHHDILDKTFIPYAFVLVFELILAFAFRAGVQKILKEPKEEKNDERL
ncbi:MAG: hypothetical protein PHQ22_08990 [Sulfuricurvum sp.]|nr:hypothetical protein [Sulfuricurvum sp.]